MKRGLGTSITLVLFQRPRDLLKMCQQCPPVGSCSARSWTCFRFTSVSPLCRTWLHQLPAATRVEKLLRQGMKLASQATQLVRLALNRVHELRVRCATTASALRGSPRPPRPAQEAGTCSRRHVCEHEPREALACQLQLLDALAQIVVAHSTTALSSGPSRSITA